MSLGEKYLKYRNKDVQNGADAPVATTDAGTRYLAYRAKKSELNVRSDSPLNKAAWAVGDYYENWMSGLGFENAPFAETIRDTREDTRLVKQADEAAKAKAAAEAISKVPAFDPVTMSRNKMFIDAEKQKPKTLEEAIERQKSQTSLVQPTEAQQKAFRGIVQEQDIDARKDIVEPFAYSLGKSLGVDTLSKYIGSMFTVDENRKLKFADKAKRVQNRKEFDEWLKSETSNEGKSGIRQAVGAASSGAGYLGGQIALYVTGSAILEGIPKLNAAFEAIKNPAVRAVVKDLAMDVILETAINTPQVIASGIKEGKTGGDIAGDVLREQAINAAIGLVMAGIANNKAIRQAISDYNAGKASREALEKTVKDEAERLVKDEFGNVIDESGIVRNELGQAIDPNTGFVKEAYQFPDDYTINPEKAPVPSVDEVLPVSKVDEAVPAPAAAKGDNISINPPEGMQTRRVAERIVEDVTQPLELRKGVAEDIRSFYEVYTDKAARERAANEIAEIIKDGGEPIAVIRERLNSGRFNKTDVAAAVQLYNEIFETDIKKAQNLIADLAIAGTETGQTVQAFSMLKRSLNGGGFEYALQKQIDKINAEGVMLRGNRWKKVEIDDTIRELIKSRDAADAVAREAIEEQIFERLQNKISPTLYEKLNSFRHTAMLLSPKTHLRNIIGTSLNVAVSKPKDALAQLMEKAIPKSQRTKAIFWANDKSLYSTVMDTVDKLDETIKTSKYELSTFKGYGKKVFTAGKEKPGWFAQTLQKISDRNYKLLTQEDDIFFKFAFADNLGQFMKARGLTEVNNEAMEYAVKMADRLTFHTDTALSKLLSTAGKTKGGRALQYGVDAVQPFRKTLINVAIETARYSPLGVAKAVLADLSAVKAGKKTFAEFIDQLAAGLTGTGIMGLGFYLYSNGVITGAPNKDQDIAAFEKAAGKQPFAIRIGDTYVTYDWAEPVGAWLAAGAAVGDVMKGDTDFLNAVLDASSSGLDALFNATVFKNLREALASPYSTSVSDTAKDLISSYFLSYIPSFVSAIARAVDDTVRTTKYEKDPVKRTAGIAATKIPGLSKTQQPLMSTRGEPVKRAESTPLRVLSETLSPAFITRYNVDDLNKEILAVYEATGDRAVFPKVAPKTFVYNKTTYRLTPEEATQFQKSMGQETYQRLERLFGSPYYKRYGDTTKAKAIINAIDAAYQRAKKEVIEGRK